jgi:hypothetical protein
MAIFAHMTFSKHQSQECGATRQPTFMRIVDCGDKEEAQVESAAAISVAVSDNLEAFEHGDDVLARHAFAGDNIDALVHHRLDAVGDRELRSQAR